MPKVIEVKKRSSCVADDLLEQYKCFLQVVKKEHDFEFRNCKERGHVFLYAHINDKKFQPLWSVFKLLLAICYSQAMVKRGFSINTDVVTPNLKNETLVSLRTVYDAINVMGIDLSCFVVPKELLADCRCKIYAYKFCKKCSYSVLKRCLSSVINCFVHVW